MRCAGITIAVVASLLGPGLMPAQVRLTPAERSALAALDSIAGDIVRDSGRVSAQTHRRVERFSSTSSGILEWRTVAALTRVVMNARNPVAPPGSHPLRLDSVRVSLGPVLARQRVGPLRACDPHRSVLLANEETISGQAAKLVGLQADAACTAIQATATALAPGARADAVSFVAHPDTDAKLILPLVGPNLGETTHCPGSIAIGAEPVVVSGIAASKVQHRIADLCSAGVELGRRQYDTLDLTVRVMGFAESTADTTLERNEETLAILSAVSDYLAWRVDSSSTFGPPVNTGRPLDAAFQISRGTAGVALHAPIDERVALLIGGASLRDRGDGTLWKLGAALSLRWVEPFATVGHRSGSSAAVVEAGAMLRCSRFALRPGAAWTSFDGVAFIVALPITASANQTSRGARCAG